MVTYMRDINIHVFQAGAGDSFIVSIIADEKMNILIDCGEITTYSEIKKKLIELNELGQHLDCVILTHTHVDHIGGAIPLFSENGHNRDSHVIKIKNVLYNGFLGLKLQNYPQGQSNRQEQMLLKGICTRKTALLEENLKNKQITIPQEMCLSKLLLDGEYCWNNIDKEEHSVLLADEVPYIELGENTGLYILSPMKKCIQDMNAKWESYIKAISGKINLVQNDLFESAYEAALFILENEDYETISHLISDRPLNKEDIQELAIKKINKDYTEENRSSIAVLLVVDDKRILFLADASITDCKRSLDKLFPNKEVVYMDLIKLSHHGSIRNISDDFLSKYRTNNYLICGGDNQQRPAIETLAKLLIYSEESTNIYVTNRNDAINKIDTPDLHEEFDFKILDASNSDIFIGGSIDGQD